jgi:hypothetical protein
MKRSPPQRAATLVAGETMQSFHQPLKETDMNRTQLQHDNFLAALTKATKLAGLTLLAATLMLALAAAPARAQGETPAAAEASPESEALKKLKEENSLLEQKLKKAENQKKLIDTYFPGTEQELPKGSLTLENNPYFETQILAHQVMSESALGLGKQMLGKMPQPYGRNRLFIYNEQQFASPFFYRAYLSQLDLLEQRYTSLPNMAPTPTPTPDPKSAQNAAPGFSPFMLLPIIEGVLGSAADIASFFKTDTVIRGVNFDIDELAFISQIGHEPIRNGVQVIYPAVLPPNLFDKSSKLMDRVGALYVLRVRAATEIARLTAQKQPIDEEIAELEERIKVMQDGPAKEALLQQKNAKAKSSKAIGDRMTPYKTLNQLFEDLVAGLLKPGDNSGVTTLVQLLKAEKLHEAVGDGRCTGKPNETCHNSYILVFKLKTGGNVKTTSGVFRSTKHYHSGGAIISYALFNSDMQMIDAATDHKYKGYIKVRSKTEDGVNLGAKPGTNNTDAGKDGKDGKSGQ